MKNILKYFFLTFIILGSCITTDKESITYFGGKILHPKTEYVLLYNQDKLIDSLFLNEHNKFFAEYTDFKEGFYYFQHGPEHQYIYIEPKDSILIRLNTWDFDETLVFSGSGAEKNNILIDCFLEGEKEEKNHNLYMYYALDSKQFKVKMDSLLMLRQRKIDVFKTKYEDLPEQYLDLLDISAKFPIYNRFEKYPSRYKYLNKVDEFPEIDSKFYSYRDNININNDTLMFLQPYSRYVVNRLYNNVYSQGFNSKSKKFTVALLNTVDKHINGEKLKNTLLREMVVNDFLEKSSCNIDNDVFQTYFELSSNIEDKKQVQRLLNDVKNLHGGSELVDFEVHDYNKAKINIKSLVKNKNSVVYIWNPKFISADYLTSRISYLSKNFPHLNFIGIKIKSFNNDDSIPGIDIKTQFYIDAESKANEFLTSKLPRTLLIDKKGAIVNGYASINSSLIIKQLKYLQKK